jgi:hypothetical protein
MHGATTKIIEEEEEKEEEEDSFTYATIAFSQRYYAVT